MYNFQVLCISRSSVQNEFSTLIECEAHARHDRLLRFGLVEQLVEELLDLPQSRVCALQVDTIDISDHITDKRSGCHRRHQAEAYRCTGKTTCIFHGEFSQHPSAFHIHDVHHGSHLGLVLIDQQFTRLLVQLDTTGNDRHCAFFRFAIVVDINQHVGQPGLTIGITEILEFAQTCIVRIFQAIIVDFPQDARLIRVGDIQCDVTTTASSEAHNQHRHPLGLHSTIVHPAIQLDILNEWRTIDRVHPRTIRLHAIDGCTKLAKNGGRYHAPQLQTCVGMEGMENTVVGTDVHHCWTVFQGLVYETACWNLGLQPLQITRIGDNLARCLGNGRCSVIDTTETIGAIRRVRLVVSYRKPDGFIAVALTIHGQSTQCVVHTQQRSRELGVVGIKQEAIGTAPSVVSWQPPRCTPCGGQVVIVGSDFYHHRSLIHSHLAVFHTRQVHKQPAGLLFVENICTKLRGGENREVAIAVVTGTCTSQDTTRGQTIHGQSLLALTPGLAIVDTRTCRTPGHIGTSMTARPTARVQTCVVTTTVAVHFERILRWSRL
ncbi:MAG: hypothetical protein POELPBGB_04186 [Bacteroidia bacterium]|nr:hypothetical protein [Bacteroidia bacterium]